MGEESVDSGGGVSCQWGRSQLIVGEEWGRSQLMVGGESVKDRGRSPWML